ncbi:MAG: J domain-containing protein [Robiginitomaculum sp.]|nr:J domain-containing protein [Robiginitomaculum sp.]
MDDDFEYEPKLFDIRVKPPGKDDAKKGERECEWDGCVTKGDCKAPQSPDKINEFFYFCKKHAAQYNKTWNFFHGMSDGAVRAYQADQVSGNRPTWSMNRNLDGKGLHAKGARFKDTFGIMGEKVSDEVDAPKRRLGRLQSLAMDTLGLDYDSSPKIVRARYLKLVKQFHPDANKGDRSTEERLQQVIRAYQVLKTSRLA